jgi:hypothetical protein
LLRPSLRIFTHIFTHVRPSAKPPQRASFAFFGDLSNGNSHSERLLAKQTILL